MTVGRKFKQEVRERMKTTGRSYQATLAIVLAEKTATREQRRAREVAAIKAEFEKPTDEKERTK